jgi:RNA polymerase sigma-70 factor, ECF subfamily
LRRQRTLRMESLDDNPDEGGHVSPALMRDWREIPSEALERQEVRQILQDAIYKLSPIYREVLLLRDVEGLSIQEASAALMVGTSTVKVRLHRARLMLQKQLAPQLKSMNPKRRWFR